MTKTKRMKKTKRKNNFIRSFNSRGINVPISSVSVL
jgi:putative protein kinase ArgK-like GTPase of G3E family